MRDPLGYDIPENAPAVHDLHATILNQMGIDPTKLSYSLQGRDFRLTAVVGNVIRKLIV